MMAVAVWVGLGAVAMGQESMASEKLPAPGTYKIDSDHTFVYFSAWHWVVGRVRGRFEQTSGTITVGSEPSACALDIAIETATITTQNTDRDEDLRGPDFFDVKKFPAMTYQGRGIRRGEGDTWVMDGTLTIRGISKAVPLMFRFNGLFANQKPEKPARAAFHATASTKRGDFGMTRDNLFELGTAKGQDVAIEIDVEANEVK
jgi:polyisoprenoid-binding protein YceI